MSVTTKMSVDVSGFKRGMAEAQASVKTMDAALKKNEAAYKATGNAEDYMSKKADILKQKLDSQNKAAKAAEQALLAMGKNGVDPASQEYQKMAQTLLNAQTAALETQNALNGLGESTQQAATGADNLTKSVNGISKKISLDQVITGVNKITTGLENAAKKAVQLGQELWNVIMDSAKRADDTATMAQMYGIDLDTFLRMQKLVAGGMDTSVDAMLTAQDKLTKGVGKGSDEVLGKLKELGVGIRTGILTDHTSWRDKTPDELFWDVGDALMHMSDAYDKEATAQTLFGRSWKELVPLFESYHSMEEYNAALEQQTVNSEEAIRDLAELNDAVSNLESSWTTLKDELLGAIAPALTKGAEAIGGLLDRLTEYLKTDEGQQMLDRLGKAVEGLFDDISEIDPESVVSGFVGVFESIIGGLEWIINNKDKVVGALEGIVIGWGALKLTGGALEILKIINGLQGLSGGAASAAGEAVGSSWGAGLAAGLMKAAPWVIGLINLLTPSGTANDDEYSNGQITANGLKNLKESIQSGEFFSGAEYGGWGEWGHIGTWLMSHIDSSDWDDMMNNYAVLNALAAYKTGNSTENELIGALERLGYTIKEVIPDEDYARNHPAYVPGSEAGTYVDPETGAIYNLQNEIVGYDARILMGQPGGKVPEFRGKRAKENPDAQLPGEFQQDWNNYFADVRNNKNYGQIAATMQGLSTVMISAMSQTLAAGSAMDVPAKLSFEQVEQSVSAVGTVHIPAQLDIGGISSSGGGTVGRGDAHVYDAGYRFYNPFGHANGLPFVPYDGYLSVLHRGERVMTASENRHYTYNSNNYFGNVNLNNGQDIEALTDAIDRRNRRQRSGYGA